MTYNLHPIIVHFPIAFLFLYAVIKILPMRKWFPRISWMQIEILLLSVGVVGAIGANITGNIAEKLLRPDPALVNMHELFASVSILTFALLWFGEILSLYHTSIISQWKMRKVVVLLEHLQKILTHPLISKILAFIGLVALMLTGLLGGVMVHGTSVDPLAPFVLNILGIPY